MPLVLIVDDSAFQRDWLSQCVEENGHETLVADGGAAGLEMLRDQRPAVVLLDLLMPPPDGFQVLATLQEENDETPIIVVTADAQEQVRTRCISLGAREVLTKPPTTDLLGNAINRALAATE